MTDDRREGSLRKTLSLIVKGSLTQGGTKPCPLILTNFSHRKFFSLLGLAGVQVGGGCAELGIFCLV